MMGCTVSLVQSANTTQSSAAETEVCTMPQPRRGSCVGSSELMTFDLHSDAQRYELTTHFNHRGDALLGSEICSRLWLQANCGSHVSSLMSLSNNP